MDDLHARILRLYDTAQHASLDEFSHFVLPDLKSAIGYDSAALYSLTLQPNRRIRLNACLTEGGAREKLEYRVSEMRDGHQDEAGRVRSRDRLIERGFNQPGRSFFMDTQAVGDRQLLAYTRRFQTAHAFLHTTPMGRDIGVLSLWRARRPDRFNLGDAARGDVLLPHVFKALRINRQLAEWAPQPGASSALQIVCNAVGTILFSDEGASALLSQEWAQWNPPCVPQPLMQALAHHAQYQGRHLRASAHLSARLWIIKLRAVPHGHQLTPAELAVARLAARSLSYKEVARELGTSPATVRNQLHSVYGKLNINGKAALAQALRAA